jgi:hypothetical protein
MKHRIAKLHSGGHSQVRGKRDFTPQAETWACKGVKYGGKTTQPLESARVPSAAVAAFFTFSASVNGFSYNGSKAFTDWNSRPRTD